MSNIPMPRPGAVVAKAEFERLRAEVERLQEECRQSTTEICNLRAEVEQWRGKIKQLKVGNEKLKTEVWHLQAVNGALQLTLQQAKANLKCS